MMETPNRLMEHRSRQGRWMTPPDDAETAVRQVLSDAFAAFDGEGVAFVKLSGRTQAAIVKALARLISAWRPKPPARGKVWRGIRPDDAAERAGKIVAARVKTMKSLAKKHDLVQCASVQIDLEFLAETINENLAELFEGWKSHD
jgi:hypothetical protein